MLTLYNAVSIINHTQNQVLWLVVRGFSPMAETDGQTAIVADSEVYSSRAGGPPRGTWSRSKERFMHTGCHADFSLASTASLREPARRKKAAEC